MPLKYRVRWWLEFQCPFQRGPHAVARNCWYGDVLNEYRIFPFWMLCLRSAVADHDVGLGDTAQVVESASAVGECNGNSVTHEVRAGVRVREFSLDSKRADSGVVLSASLKTVRQHRLERILATQQM